LISKSLLNVKENSVLQKETKQPEKNGGHLVANFVPHKAKFDLSCLSLQSKVYPLFG
jgi:hypothetical protein